MRRLGRSVAQTVARLHHPGVTIDMRIGGNMQDVGYAAGVVVMPMAQDQHVGLLQIDPEGPGIHRQGRPLSGVEKDMAAVGLDPKRKAMLGCEARSGLVVDQDGDGDR